MIIYKNKAIICISYRPYTVLSLHVMPASIGIIITTVYLALSPGPFPHSQLFCVACCYMYFSVCNIEKAAMGLDLGMSLRYGSLVHVCTHYRYLVSTPSAMTDQERDEIDSAAQDFIRSCSDKIENLHHKGTFIHCVY